MKDYCPCGDIRVATKVYCRRCLNQSQIIFNEKRRRKVIEAYGGKCRCCGESTYEFLAIDHLDNDGAKDRKVNGRGAKLIGRIIRAGFPPRYQVLCHNCNLAKAFHSRCPHEGPSTR
jgi:hypothetical protein